MEILYFRNPVISFSGGHEYNEKFVRCLSTYLGEKIKEFPEDISNYSKIRKLLIPFVRLKWLKFVKDDMLIFFGDTAYRKNLFLAVCIRLFFKCKSVVIVHHFPLRTKGIISIIDRALLDMYIHNMNSIIVPSLYTLDVAKQRFSSKSIYYIPIPFSNEYHPSDNYECGNFLYVGSIEERKGLIYLIDALGIIKRQNPKILFSLNVVGRIVQFKYYDCLLKRIKLLGLEANVHFLGRISNEELEYCYQKAEIFTCPSLLEGYGIVFIEAMRHGIPIIAFNNTAMPYTIIDGVNGMLVDNKNSMDFAEKILLLTGNRELHERYRKGISKTISSIKTYLDFERAVHEFSKRMNL